MRFELQSATGTGEIVKVEEGLVSETFNIPERCLPEDIDNSCYSHLKDIEIPRCYLSRLEHKGVTFQLHHFCDASESGYGTVSYLRFAYLDGFTECAFVTGKSIGKSPLLALVITKKVNTFFTCFDWLA